MFLSYHNTINNTENILFRRFVKEHGRVKYRRVLLAFENNHSHKAISHQLSIPLTDVQEIAQLYRRSA